MVAPSIDLSAFDVLTFDCYGTLIDWESGLLAACPSGARRTRASTSATTQLLETYARHEAELEVGPVPHLPRGAGRRAARRGRRPRLRAQRRRGGRSSRDRSATGPRSRTARRRSHRLHRALPARRRSPTATTTSSPRRPSGWGWTSTGSITAQQARSYKPQPRATSSSPSSASACPRERILHVAQSLFHDHVTAKRAGHDHGLGRPPRTGAGARAPRRRPRPGPTSRCPTCARSRTWPRAEGPTAARPARG